MIQLQHILTYVVTPALLGALTIALRYRGKSRKKNRKTASHLPPMWFPQLRRPK